MDGIDKLGCLDDIDVKVFRRIGFMNRMHGCMYVRIDALIHGCMDAWMHGYMDARIHGCMDA